MPGKSKHGKGRTRQSKRSRAMRRHETAAPQAPEASETPRPAAAASKAPSSQAPASAVRPKTVAYPYVKAELKTIGILAAIVIVILVVLAQVLS
jgi:hypothetical protein